LLFVVLIAAVNADLWISSPIDMVLLLLDSMVLRNGFLNALLILILIICFHFLLFVVPKFYYLQVFVFLLPCLSHRSEKPYPWPFVGPHCKLDAFRWLFRTRLGTACTRNESWQARQNGNLLRKKAPAVTMTPSVSGRPSTPTQTMVKFIPSR